MNHIIKTFAKTYAAPALVALSVAACSGAGRAALDGTDALSLEGSFTEVALGLDAVDARKAAAAMQIIAFQEDERYADDPLSELVEEAQSDAVFFLPASQGGELGGFFAESRSEAYQEMAAAAGTRLDGMSGADLVAFYDRATGQAREEDAERERAEAEAEARAQAEAEAEAARQEAERQAAEAARRESELADLRERLSGLEGAEAHNAERAETLQSTLVALVAKRDEMAEKRDSMATLEKIYRYSWGIGAANVKVTNTTDAPITLPEVGFALPDNDIRTRINDTDLHEQRKVSIAPGESAVISFPFSVFNPEGLPKRAADLRAEPFLGAYVTGGERVVLYLPKSEREAITVAENAIAACEAATESIPAARQALQAGIARLEGGEDAAMDAIPAARC